MKHNFARHRMTLIEILVAMTILMVIMYIVMQTFSSTQIIWRKTGQTSDLYEKARLITSLLTQDLQQIAVSDTPGAEITWSTWTAGLPPDMQIAFVSSSGIGVEAGPDKSLLAEIGYKHTDSRLFRCITTQSETAAKWDFLDNPTSTWAAVTSWEDETLVTDHVMDFTVIAYNDASVDMKTTAATSFDANTLPQYIYIEFTLRAMNVHENQADDNSTDRKFSKLIYLAREYD